MALEWMLGFGRVLASTLDAGSNAILWSIEYLTGDEASTKEPPYCGLGTYGRPRPPVSTQDATLANPAGECEVLAWREPDRTYVFASRDFRLLRKVNPIVGEVGMAGYDGGFISIRPNVDEDGSTITLYAPRNVDPPKASQIQMVSTDGNQQIAIEHESGQSVVLNPQGQVMITGSSEAGPSQGNSWISVDEADGVILNAANIAANGFCMLGDKASDATGADFVALAQKVLDELTTFAQVFEAHTHSAPAGGGQTGTPTPAGAYTPQPVAAIKVKAV